LESLLVFLIVAVLLPQAALAGGIVHGSKASGMSSAFIAVADDPSAILHNPAGLTQLHGTSLYGGATLVMPSSTYTAPSGQSVDTETQVFLPPHLFVATDFGAEKAVFGLGVFAPFGIGGRKWPADGPTRYGSVESFIGTVTINPTVAVALLPGLSVAAGLRVEIRVAQMQRHLAGGAVLGFIEGGNSGGLGRAGAHTHGKTNGNRQDKGRAEYS